MRLSILVNGNIPQDISNAPSPFPVRSLTMCLIQGRAENLGESLAIESVAASPGLKSPAETPSGGPVVRGIELKMRLGGLTRQSSRSAKSSDNQLVILHDSAIVVRSGAGSSGASRWSRPIWVGICLEWPASVQPQAIERFRQRLSARRVIERTLAQTRGPLLTSHRCRPSDSWTNANTAGVCDPPAKGINL
jgi:hypothetical protein